MTQTLILAGCGKMGEAMLSGWLERGMPPSDIIIVEPNIETADKLSAKYGVQTHTEPKNITIKNPPDFIVFAVKPQIMDKVTPEYARFTGPNTTFLSIVAGKPVSYFQKNLGDDAIIIRAMPNTPAAIRRGITVAYPNVNVSDAQRMTCDRLLKSVGTVEWIDDEGMIDAVTALSGGGPAYVFFLVEVMAEAGKKAGLPDALAERLARETVSGAGELLRQSDEDPKKLRINVTSPAGTTAEALTVLMADDGMRPMMVKAIAAAKKRSKELAK
jgi:pyrroline-5-carboxylate reductase